MYNNNYYYDHFYRRQNTYSIAKDSRYSGSLKYGHLDIPAINLVWDGFTAQNSPQTRFLYNYVYYGRI